MRFLWLFLALALAGCNSANQTSLVTPTIAEAHEAATAPAISQTLETGVIRSFGGAYSHPPAEALLQETLQDLTRASSCWIRRSITPRPCQMASFSSRAECWRWRTTGRKLQRL